MAVRTCIGCRRAAPSEELMRVVAGAGGGLDIGRSLPGRGAWLCVGSVACVDAAARRGAFSRALRTEVEAGAVASLRTQWAEHANIQGNNGAAQGP